MATYLETINDTVQSRFDHAYDWANTSWEYAATYLDQLTILLQNYTPAFIDLDFDIPPINVDAYTPQRPTGLVDTLRTQIEADLEVGGTGLDADTRQAFYDSQVARQELLNERVYDEALSHFASLGWNIPPGALEGRLSEARLEQVRAEADISRDVMIKEAELTLSNEQFIMNTALSFFGNETQLYGADIQLAATQIEAEIKSYDVQQRHEESILTLQLKEAEINLAMILESYKMQAEAIRAGANIYAQLAASSMSGVSAAANMSFSGGYSKSYGESKSQSYSESHTYSH